jgi:hypothetical protein
VAPDGGALPFRLGPEAAAPALFDIARDNDLVQGVDLARVVPRRARAVLGGTPVASAAPGPVLAEGPGWVALGFDPDASVLAASPAYPILVGNALARLGRVAGSARPEFHAVGEAVSRAGVAQVDGAGAVRFDGRLLGPPGFWRVGDAVYPVNLLLDDLDLAPAGPSDPLPTVGTAGRPARQLAPEFAAAGVVALLLAWWVFWRGSKRRGTMEA